CCLVPDPSGHVVASGGASRSPRDRSLLRTSCEPVGPPPMEQELDVGRARLEPPHEDAPHVVRSPRTGLAEGPGSVRADLHPGVALQLLSAVVAGNVALLFLVHVSPPCCPVGSSRSPINAAHPLSAAQESPLRPEGRVVVSARGEAERDRSMVCSGPCQAE